MSNAIVEVTDDSFSAEIEQHKGVALLDFWATWCMPCRRIGPIIDELAEEFKGKVKVAKLNVEDAPDATARFGVRSIPALLLFKDGANIDQHIGPATKDSLRTWLNNNVA